MAGDYIRRDDALFALRKAERGGSMTALTRLERAYAEIREMPAADVAEVVHGQWCVSKIRSIETVFYCSECKRTVTVGNDFFGEAPQSASAAYPYCHCGAKMDGGNGAAYLALEAETTQIIADH